MPNQNAISVANTFIDRFSDAGLDHLKLQKLCYYAYGWWLGLRAQDAPLINVRPQVWKLGPVFQPIYGAFAHSKNNWLKRDDLQRSNPFSDEKPLIQRDETPDSQIIDWIWGRYGSFSGMQLSELTHEPGTPWHDIAKAHNFIVPKYYEMPDDAVRAYFHQLGVKEGLI